jgi:DNA repair protein RecO (recombination protein O)
LGTLTAAEQVAAPPGLHQEALYCGMYLNELLLRLLHRNDPHPEVFERYRRALSGLSSGDPMQALLRVFEKHLLDALGYGLILDHEFQNGEALLDDAWYEYLPDRGPRCASNQIDPRRRLVSGRALRALKEERFDDETLVQLKRTMRRILRHHLGEKPLKSFELFSKQ